MYTVEPIHCATIESVSKGIMTYLVDMEVRLDIPVFSFLVTATDPDDDTVILVDTGSPEPTDGTVAGRTVQGGGPGPIVSALDERGLSPADVDYVVLSHLHWDHVGNNGLFPDARLVVQQDEIDCARDPLPYMERIYFQERVEELAFADTMIVNGDHTLVAGVELLATPGHSDGIQTVVVETTAGPVAVLTDVADCRHNVEPGRSEIRDAHGNRVETTPTDAAYLPPGFHSDVATSYESFEKILDRVGADAPMLCGHDGDLIGTRYP
jgi:glyoxylase-like metal-dependent hydrolase (beta-lactamase superfamily II)